MRRVGNWAGGLLLAVLALVVAEGALQLLSRRVRSLDTLLAPSWALTLYIPDSVLGLRGNPKWFDHDTWGYRNPSVVSKADVVVLGDSHSYGIGVARSETWPLLLGRGQVSYNMSFGGWGPGQGYLELNRALTLHPGLVIYGFYFGNDLVDAFEIASRRPELRRFIPLPLADTTAALESREPIARRAQQLFALSTGPDQESQGDTLWSLRRFLSDHSKLYALARALRNAVGRSERTPALLSRDMDLALARISAQQRRSILAYRGPEWKGLLTPAYRNLVIDDRDPRVRAGEEATEGMLAEMDSLCRGQGVRFLVALLPTKESVFAPRIPDQDRSASLDSLVRNEMRTRDELTSFLARRRIAYLDVLPHLQAATAQPYFQDADGHPNEAGHRVIAEAVLRRMRTLKR